MSNYKKLVFYILPFYSLFALSICYAQDPNGQVSHKADFQKAHEIYNQLNLTDDQKKLLEANRTKNRAGMKALFERMKSCREALNAELMKPNLDMARINEINSQLKTLQSQLIDERLASIIEVRKILTAGQFAQFISLREKHRFTNKQE